MRKSNTAAMKTSRNTKIDESVFNLSDLWNLQARIREKEKQLVKSGRWYSVVWMLVFVCAAVLSQQNARFDTPMLYLFYGVLGPSAIFGSIADLYGSRSSPPQ